MHLQSVWCRDFGIDFADLTKFDQPSQFFFIGISTFYPKSDQIISFLCAAGTYSAHAHIEPSGGRMYAHRYIAMHAPYAASPRTQTHARQHKHLIHTRTYTHTHTHINALPSANFGVFFSRFTSSFTRTGEPTIEVRVQNIAKTPSEPHTDARTHTTHTHTHTHPDSPRLGSVAQLFVYLDRTQVQGAGFCRVVLNRETVHEVSDFQ